MQPIIPISRKEPFDDPDWLFEFKYDGFRALLYLEQGSGRFLSRNGNSLTRFDALARAVAAELEVTDAIFDGEVIAADESGRPLFYDLLRRTRRPVYVAFDLLWPRVPTCVPGLSASAADACRAFCRWDPEQSPRHSRFMAGDALSSISCATTTSRASWPNVWRIRTVRG
jgi:hypothetical protein